MSSILEGFEVQPLEQTDAAVQTRVDAFYKHIGISKQDRPSVVKWFGLFKNGTNALVIALFMRSDGAIEITDLYPAPTRNGVKAGYVALKLLKLLVDEGMIPFWIAGVVARNKFGQRHVAKFFGIAPTSIVYQYGKGIA